MTEKADSLRRYLAARGQHVTSLSLDGGYGGADKPSLSQHLPAGALQSLEIQGYKVALSPVLHCSVSGLTRLELGWGNTLVGAPKGLTALTGLKALRHMELHNRKDAACPANILHKMVQLTHINLAGFKFSAAGSLAGLSSLSGLQHLDLGVTVTFGTADHG
jgi:hypothetical protein